MVSRLIISDNHIRVIKIGNINEWVDIQKFLFNLGWGWANSCKKVIYIKDYNHNYNNILIILDNDNLSMTWSFGSVLSYEEKFNLEIENAGVILRREKLKKLSK